MSVQPGCGEMAGAGMDGFTGALGLRSAQKSAEGAPPYSPYVNRPLGRILAAAAYQIDTDIETITSEEVINPAARKFGEPDPAAVGNAVTVEIAPSRRSRSRSRSRVSRRPEDRTENIRW